MKKFFLLSLLLVSTLGANAEELSSQPQLDDLISPDEIAEELGFPRTEMGVDVLSYDDFYKSEAADFISEYPLVVIINKSNRGPTAQTLVMYENGFQTSVWQVSTGRERWELAKSGRRYFSATPVGYFYPYQLVRNHYSHTWKANMEFSVFFNGGVAVHATTPDHYKELGTRASGGCVRLLKENAEYFYRQIEAHGKGLMPVIKRDGTVSKDRWGNPVRAIKWKTLIVVINE
ncbi:L,D-transpeptidase [Bdellovibrio reynosensis]|uniref:L,D-transpeptidase n=1 Tax=Bdellovibrio reynosensis TaxID=2835041 RepID=A0ABY4C8D2_9BACT|nr:L,D-transpeptidase [Bdellovibrio reynosensis]UOF01182.1 L,D-transpeptidase [Bdellovibrio reynosensis]